MPASHARVDQIRILRVENSILLTLHRPPYVPTYIYNHAYIRTFIHTCHIHMYICTCIQHLTHAHMHARKYVCGYHMHTHTYVYVYIYMYATPPRTHRFHDFRHNPVKYCSASTLRRHQAARTQEACTLARTPTLGSRTTGISGSCHGTGISLSLLLVKDV